MLFCQIHRLHKYQYAFYAIFQGYTHTSTYICQISKLHRDTYVIYTRYSGYINTHTLFMLDILVTQLYLLKYASVMNVRYLSYTHTQTLFQSLFQYFFFLNRERHLFIFQTHPNSVIFQNCFVRHHDYEQIHLSLKIADMLPLGDNFNIESLDFNFNIH